MTARLTKSNAAVNGLSAKKKIRETIERWRQLDRSIPFRVRRLEATPFPAVDKETGLALDLPALAELTKRKRWEWLQWAFGDLAPDAAGIVQPRVRKEELILPGLEPPIEESADLLYRVWGLKEVAFHRDGEVVRLETFQREPCIHYPSPHEICGMLEKHHQGSACDWAGGSRRSTGHLQG